MFNPFKKPTSTEPDSLDKNKQDGEKREEKKEENSDIKNNLEKDSEKKDFKREGETENIQAEVAQAIQNNKGKDIKDIEEDEDKEIEEKIAKEIVIHTMPGKFHLDSKKLNKAKITGIVVIVGGFIVIVVLAIFLYFYIFKFSEKKDAALSDLDKFIPPSTSQDLQQDEQPAEKDEEIEDSQLDTTKEDLDKVDSVATTTIDEEIEPEATSTPSDIVVIGDSDGDGLTAKEEILLGSDDKTTDSDGDDYLDYQELMSLYNPVGPDKLIDNPNIGEYINKTFFYSVLYPINWPKSVIGGDDSIMFKSDDNHFIQIIIQPNVDQQSIEDWYQQQFVGENVEEERLIVTDSWQGIRSKDGLIVYLTDNSYNYIFVLSYNSGSDNILSYKNIFAMMVKSFVISD